jgi:DNA-directed RNA polymerase specialized sigma24 family protein
VQEDEKRAGQERLLAAIVALLVDARTSTDREVDLKSEVLLAGVGLSAAEIAPLVGKQPNAVRMTLSRARKGAQ